MPGRKRLFLQETNLVATGWMSIHLGVHEHAWPIPATAHQRFLLLTCGSSRPQGSIGKYQPQSDIVLTYSGLARHEVLALRNTVLLTICIVHGQLVALLARHEDTRGTIKSTSFSDADVSWLRPFRRIKKQC